MTSPSSTILIEDDELPPSWRSGNSQAQRTSPRTSLETPIEPNDATSGSIEPSRKRKRAKRKQPDTLDTCFKRLRKTFDERDQEVEKLDQEVENLEKTSIKRSFPDDAFWTAKYATSSRIVGIFYYAGI
ncbi:hypothetical protein PENNAL_c0402G04862 [Penicillium nalgiovense]|uniref:Uncharacterized protein n=1 Tax=Penicillium nalgiovense TaxID=60175 RepID=A0A1V6W3J3_PENNA|nr:hypothetical protein PENNAL_c0402G04862 [Penicillium nalgiovense]